MVLPAGGPCAYCFVAYESHSRQQLTQCTQVRQTVSTNLCRLLRLLCSGSYDLIGRVYASGAMGVPLALHVLSGDAGERAVYGDSRGAAVLLLCGSRELPARDLISTETHKVS